MQLIGMLDSPYVRRVAISFQLLGLKFEHRSLSVFRTFDEFSRINPVVKAPTLVCDDGEVLMDSTLILDYAEALARPRTLLPAGLKDRQHSLRLIGLALAATEKSVQIVYEHGLRPAEKVHAPWLGRVTGQMQAAFGELEQALAARMPPQRSAELDQVGVTLAPEDRPAVPAAVAVLALRAFEGQAAADQYQVLAKRTLGLRGLPAVVAALSDWLGE